MRWFKWGFRFTLLALVALFLWYTLPQHDVVRITDAYNRLTTVSWENKYFFASPDAGSAESKTSRDVRFINAVFPNGHVIVYRNEDTGWLWPPYFKYDSSNLQAEASNLKSSAQDPRWVMVTRYGWRIPFLSIYPNAVRLREVSGPDVSYFPWLNLTILALLALGVFWLWRMWLQFVERVVIPTRAKIEDRWDRFRAFFLR